MIPTLTPFPMYDFVELADAHDDLRRRIDESLRRAALDIAITQTCGYPLVTSLRGRFEALAAPVYDVPFSSGSTHRGLVVVGADAPCATLADLRGSRFALNAADSNTGMNLPRRLFAPLAERGRFFGSVVETGSHLASLAAIRDGTADVASIDNVTYALLGACRPAAVAGTRVLATTAASPALPFVIPAFAPERTRALAFDALADAIGRFQGSASAAKLHLAGVERASLAAYDPLLRLEREAADLGYGALR